MMPVDDQGQYWIQNDTRNVEGMTTGDSVCNTFVNEERLKPVELRLLKSGDRISFGDLTTFGLHLTFWVAAFMEGTIGGIRSRLQTDGDSDNEVGTSVATLAEAPMANNLVRDVLEKIMSYLPVKDLKSARLVCKQWKEEASKVLEKKGMVSLTFNASDYENPENSTRVFRYLHEMRDLKMRNLHINLQPTSPLTCRFDDSQLYFSRRELGLKVYHDLRKLLESSHNFSSLFLQGDMENKIGYLYLSLTFRELREKLVELKLGINYYFIPAEAELPAFPVMRNLKKLTDTGEMFDYASSSRWVSHFVPLFSNNLEHFVGNDLTTDPYLEEFVYHSMPKLKGIELKEGACEQRTFSALLELETPLTVLEIQYDKGYSEPEELFERVLLKNSKSLRHLVIRIPDGDGGYYSKDPDVKFPSFPMLEELELEYGREATISWDNGLSYEEHFPSLRKLTVKPRQRWSEDDPVFNAFFPEEGELRSETVKEVWIPVLSNDSFQRIDQIKKMFPKAEKINFLQ